MKQQIWYSNKICTSTLHPLNKIQQLGHNNSIVNQDILRIIIYQQYNEGSNKSVKDLSEENEENKDSTMKIRCTNGQGKKYRIEEHIYNTNTVILRFNKNKLKSQSWPLYKANNKKNMQIPLDMYHWLSSNTPSNTERVHLVYVC